MMTINLFYELISEANQKRIDLGSSPYEKPKLLVSSIDLFLSECMRTH